MPMPLAIKTILKNLQKDLEQSLKETQVPGASIAVLYKGEIYRAAAGITNVNTNIKVTSDTLFHIGSVSKLFTATQVMQLVDQGKVDLDMPYSHYVPEFELQDEKARKTITIRQLLSHTSGIMGDFFEDTGRGDDCLKKYAKACKKISTVHDPGQIFSYCNAGFSLLGRLIEKLTGKIWEETLEQSVFKPLGMCYCAALPERELHFTSAVGHEPLAEWPAPPNGEWKVDGKYRRSVGPAGSVIAVSPTELIHFVQMHLNGGVAADGTRILSKESVKKMQEVQVDIPYSLRYKAWGLGWMRFDWSGQNVIGHDGGTASMGTFLRIIPEKGVAIAMSGNGGDTGALIFRSVFAKLLKELADVELPGTPEPDPALKLDLSKYTGTFRRYGMEVKVDYKNDKLTALVSSKDGEDNVPMPMTFNVTPVTKEIFQVSVIPGMPPMIMHFINFDSEGRPGHLHSGERALKRLDQAATA
ncbi:MAG: serine hydrolase domain-containing protein [Thermodesulfobacteriota bacterium]